MKKMFAIAAMLMVLSACSKNNATNSTTDYSGKYQGRTIAKSTVSGMSGTAPYDMVLDVSKGDNSQEIKILFGSWLTVAKLNGTDFTIQQTTFPGPIITTGNGTFSGNNMNINYTQTAGVQTTNYTGTLSKF